MRFHETSLSIKHPNVMKTLFAMCISEVSLIITMHISTNRTPDFLFFFPRIWFIFIFIIIIFLLYRFLSSKSITIGDNFIISLNKKRYDADEISSVFIDGKRIGIKTVDKKLVPLHLYFTFKKENTVNGMEEIREWAKRNNKPIRYKFFFGWI
ncbi:hypothetical protein [Paenibacillus pseudetheri]|uniref:Uncharacterized protein n=1 Tax=Paenibacillus pseudetheri TaxID=2897682 RepID=A0ABM9BFP0_9BACL|nr:hypothetical protein [Paenibacillus pseudetheri]CAH1057826.1 hypothetical protein PAECIP111894_03999 [Paenibacillus pseudetheri]